MSIIKKESRKKVKISKEGIVFDYQLFTEEQGVSAQELNGRVPDNGKYRNNKCKEICYVISGYAEVCIDDKKYKIKEGDVYVIEPKQTSYLIADKLKLVTFTSPNWSEEQCEIV